MTLAQTQSIEDAAAGEQQHRERLTGQLCRASVTELVGDFLPAERQRWQASSGREQEILSQLYHEFEPDLEQLLATTFPGEVLLAEACWQESLLLLEPGKPAPAAHLTIMQVELDRLRQQLTDPKTMHKLGEHTFESRAPLIGPFIGWFRTCWYNIAARWAVQRLAEQMTKALVDLEQRLTTTQLSVIENDRAIVELKRQLAALEQSVQDQKRA